MIYHQRQEHDAIVIGSGVTGGWAAKELCEGGLKTLILERGRNVEHGKDYITEHKQPWEMAYRGRAISRQDAQRDWPTMSRRGGPSEATAHFYLKDKGNPYIEEKPFTWVRGDQVGGRSLTWGRQSYRLSDLDFEANARDGHGVDWPIRYKDLAPWYSYVEQFAGISGQAEGLPQLPDGEFLPPMEMNAAEKVFKKGVEQAYPDRRVTIGRTAVLTAPHNGRAACHYCGPCSRGCSTGSYFSSQSTTLPAARATGNLSIRPHSLVHRIIYDEETGKATGVRFIDTQTMEMHETYARIIFLCGSALGSTQVLLNSTSNRFPNGFSNSSGALGKYLMDHHFRVGATGEMPDLDDRYYQGRRPNGIYIIRFRNLGDKASEHPDFVRGYGFQGGASRPSWERGIGGASFGTELKSSLRNPGPWRMWIGAWCETLPHEDNHVTLADETDAYGLPQLKIRCTWRENEMAMRKDVPGAAMEMLEAAGARNIQPFDNYKEDEIGAEPGLCIHEMGTARMGRDPKTSVLNGFNQCHEALNVFVTDGACMTSSACQNPSLTYMALTARAANHAVEEMKKGNL